MAFGIYKDDFLNNHLFLAASDSLQEKKSVNNAVLNDIAGIDRGIKAAVVIRSLAKCGGVD